MAAALQLPAILNVDNVLNILGTGFANTTAFTAKVRTPEPGAPDITIKGTSSGGGAIDTTAICPITMGAPGQVKVEVSDGTSTVIGYVPVWQT